MSNVLTVHYGSTESAKRFTQSLRETGFAVLSSHPIAVQLILETYDDWKIFFSSNEKLNYVFNPQLQSGYFPFRSENAKGYSTKDLKEFFHVYSWTQLPEGISNRTWELFHQLSSLAVELLGWIEDETPKDIKQKFSMPLPEMIAGSRETLLRPIHYPPLTGAEESGAIRAAAHEDINLITLLPSATVPGLQVKDRHGQWYDVPCDVGSIVINAGDMLQMASQRFYCSTTHRVINPKGEDARISRYSMPLFLHPRWDVRLSENFTAGEYLQQRLYEIGLRRPQYQGANL